MNAINAELSERGNKTADTDNLEIFARDRAFKEEMCRVEVLRAFVILESFDKVLVVVRTSLITGASFQDCLEHAPRILRAKDSEK